MSEIVECMFLIKISAAADRCRDCVVSDGERLFISKSFVELN